MHNNVIVNIISLYKQGKRLDNFMKMIDILYAKGFNLSVVLQNYPDEITKKLKNREIDVMLCEAKNPSTAENEFLKKYYNSNYDFFIMLHDDIILDTKVRTQEQDFISYFLKEVNALKKDEVAITLQENSFVYRNVNKPIIQETLHFWEPAFLFVNIYKKFKIKVFFDSDIYGAEGTAFSCSLLRNGFKVMAHYGQATFKQMLEKSTYGNHDERKEKLKKYRIQIYEKNKDIFTFTKNNQLRRIKHAIKKIGST